MQEITGSKIVCVTPVGDSAGEANTSVDIDGTSAEAATGFDYVESGVATVTSMSPTSASVKGLSPLYIGASVQTEIDTREHIVQCRWRDIGIGGVRLWRVGRCYCVPDGV